MRDRDFVASFESCTLPPEEFPHRAHVTITWAYLFLIHERMARESFATFDEFARRYDRLSGRRSDALGLRDEPDPVDRRARTALRQFAKPVDPAVLAEEIRRTI